ncbi:MAG: hypothetical protein EZS28_017828 [Streblomastix strix]|uniref:Uncharacterized protein n=1 Tax=Streblomastix strix TaxID=222440 RepID=A0A5J4VVE2_9EUKA|nr:MAG: hypothetical protein EZS28_017828 [Streblomastix strix]
MNYDKDLQRLQVRSRSRECLNYFRMNGDTQVQQELINNGYGRVMSITFCTAGGIGEELDKKIYYGLYHISWFIREQHEGRTYGQQSFQPLPLLARQTEEQLEEEGANEEIETQLINNGYNGNIKYYANKAKAWILNRFIHKY